ncbi:MAG: hypothetical protein ACFE8B_14640 [Candidatus Hermodarchaeota archaeon]
MTNYSKENVKDLTVEKIKTLNFQQIIELYKALSSVDFEELDGEYDSAMVWFISEKSEKTSKWWLYDTEKGYWLGKSFTPTNKQEQRGEGYNRWRIEGKEDHHMRFLTDISESLIDGKPTFRLKYAFFKNDGGIVDMTDEVRKIRKGLYLCAGMAGVEKVPPDFFCLFGPVNEYQRHSEWKYGDEVKRFTKRRGSFKNYPYPEDLQQ